MKIKSIKLVRVETPVDVYDIEVKEFHNFSVGEDNLIIHNCEYLHGSSSSVISNMAQNFPGTNNLPLLARSGNFGTRFTHEPSAPRYIYTYKEKYFDSLFLKDDDEILTKQYFEGYEIEPLFYLPTLPLLVINGSVGVSTGFAQKILPRNIDDVKNYLISKIQGKSLPILMPFFNGFTGVIKQGENHKQYLINGCVKRISAGKIEITEIPVSYSYKEYISVLNDLEDKGTIKSYRDKCTDGKFLFDVNMETKILSSLTDDELLDKLKLSKKISENYTSINEENQITQFENIYEILDYYINVKIKYFSKRKIRKIEELEEKKSILESKIIFINNVISNSITINNVAKKIIIEQICKITGIIKVNESFDYLLEMSLYTLTQEKINDLNFSLNKTKEELDKLKSLSEHQMWLADLDALKI